MWGLAWPGRRPRSRSSSVRNAAGSATVSVAPGCVMRAGRVDPGHRRTEGDAHGGVPVRRERHAAVGEDRWAGPAVLSHPKPPVVSALAMLAIVVRSRHGPNRTRSPSGPRITPVVSRRHPEQQGRQSVARREREVVAGLVGGARLGHAPHARSRHAGLRTTRRVRRNRVELPADTWAECPDDVLHLAHHASTAPTPTSSPSGGSPCWATSTSTTTRTSPATRSA